MYANKTLHPHCKDSALILKPKIKYTLQAKLVFKNISTLHCLLLKASCCYVKILEVHTIRRILAYGGH